CGHGNSARRHVHRKGVRGSTVACAHCKRNDAVLEHVRFAFALTFQRWYAQHAWAEWARLLQNITCVTDQPFRGGSDGSTQGITVGAKVFGSQDVGPQVEPEV